MKKFNKIDTITSLKVMIIGLLLIGIYESTLEYLIVQVWKKEDFSYGIIIPFLALYLVWDRRTVLLRIRTLPSWQGAFALLLGLSLFWIGELGGEYFSLYFSFWLVLVGLFWMNLGWEKIKVLSFAFLILLSMFPPPNFIYDKLTFQLKLLSSQMGVWMLQAYGMTAYREGNVIDLGFTQLQVVDACSGLRYLFPLLVMAILLSYFYRTSCWKKVVLVISAIPLTIVTNSLRIAMTGVLYEIWGPAVAEDFFHGFSGWLIFIFGLLVLLFEMWVLTGFKSLGLVEGLKVNKIELAESPNLEYSDFSTPDLAKRAETGCSSDIQKLPAVPNRITPLLQPPQFVVAVMLLAVTLVMAQGVEFREKIPPAQSFGEFPNQVGKWIGKRDMMDQQFIDRLDLSDYVIIDYVNGQHAINFYTAYYQSQRKGESIHSPETCLPGSGWEFRRAGSVTLPLKTRNGEPMRVNKAFMEKGTYKQLAYFWFPQRDRVLTNAWELKLYNFWDALTRQRTDGALVRLITPVYPNEEVADADRRLDAFTQQIVPVLNEFLPK